MNRIPQTISRTAPGTNRSAVIDARAARHFLLAGAGLLDDPDRPATRSSVRRCIEKMGFVQLDSICVLDRAHHHILRTRLKKYDAAILSRLHERDRHVFEHWTHDASYVPMTFFPMWTHRFRRAKERSIKRSEWWRQRLGPDPERLLQSVRDRVATDGPLRAGDITERSSGPGEPWWGWKPEKAALEHLWRIGEIAVTARKNFQKVYDLAESVYPALPESQRPSEDAYIDWSCSTALSRLGVATPSEIAAFMHGVTTGEARAWCLRAEREGRVVPVQAGTLDASAPRAAFAWHDWRDRLASLPPPPERVRFLSPFDPAIRDRARAQRLFGFDYRFEAFVPAAQRTYGYYVLPVLCGDELIARMDARLDRASGTLEVPGFWWERAADRNRRRTVRDAVAEFALELGADTVRMTGPDGNLLR